MAAENIDLGLNLVFENPASSSAAGYAGTTPGTKTKKKRKNKYDRRRERGRLAKEAKKLGKSAEDDNNNKSGGNGGRSGGADEKRDPSSNVPKAFAKNSSSDVNEMKTKNDAEPGNNEDVMNNHNSSKQIGRKKTHAFSLIVGGLGLISIYFIKIIYQ